jgi:hypothetical protein
MNAKTLFLFITVFVSTHYSYAKAFSIFSDSTIVAKASEKYKVGRFRKFLFGREYRQEWDTPVRMNVFDVGQRLGISYEVAEDKEYWYKIQLKLRGQDNSLYILKALDKTIVDDFPSVLKRNLTSFLIRDQYSSAHPYAPLVISDLAHAAALNYIKPELVYVPLDTTMDGSISLLANSSAYFEGRAFKDVCLAPATFVQGSLIGTDSLISLLERTNNIEIDVRLYAKSRLFDMLIGDWRRHNMQWLWLVKEENGKFYISPLPINHEHAFFRFDGLVPLFMRVAGFGNFQTFSKKIRNLKGLNKSSSFLDRHLLTSLTRADWIEIAETLKENLSDEAFYGAYKNMPEEVYGLSAEKNIRNLKARRDMLPKVAEEYFDFLSRVVNYSGSRRKEKYYIERFEDRSTKISVSRFLDGHEEVFFSRVFAYGETKEIRIYSLSDDDSFLVSGQADKAIKIRVVGGYGKGAFVDNSQIKKGRNIIVHTARHRVLGKNRNQRVIELRDSLTAFERTDYKPNEFGGHILPEYNVDDGLFLGMGLKRRSYSFRRYPYASSQKFGGNYASYTSAFNVKYNGDFINVFRNLNLVVDATVIGPQYAFNYFGLGNETIKTNPITFYRIRAKEYLASFFLYSNVTPKFNFGIGPMYQYMNIERTEGRFLVSSEQRDMEGFAPTHFIAGRAFARYVTIDDIVFPTRGIQHHGEIGYYKNIFGKEHFVNIKSFFALYKSFDFSVPLVFVTRVGGGTNFGAFKFFQANVLGGESNFRGFRRTRFYGRTSFYHNTELRSKLISKATFLIPVEGGAILWFDHGRVWADEESSRLWHYAMGPGLWVGLHHRWVFSATYGFAAEENVFNVRLGYLF